MVGLTSVKKVVADMAALERYARLCQQQGINISCVSNHHMIFTGNPGTGKTTVAKKIGQLFHSLGVLSKGDVITAERGTIVGRYLGDTENNMQNLFAQAKGNVLFIDEAYSPKNRRECLRTAPGIQTGLPHLPANTALRLPARTAFQVCCK